MAELRECGLSDDAIARRRKRGTLHRIYPGVYAVGSPTLSMQGRFLAATKATGGVLSHYSAASLWRLVDYDERARPQVTVPHNKPKKVAGIQIFRSRRTLATRLLDGIPVATPAEALVGLSSAMPLKPLRRAARDALALKKATIRDLLGQTRQLDEALALGYVPTRNEFEDAVHDLILTAFEPPLAQQTLVLDGVPTTPDFRWPHLHLCVEADGAQFHEHALARQDDAAKQARLEAHGERVIRVTWTQATREPQQTLKRLAAAGAPTRSPGTAPAPTE